MNADAKGKNAVVWSLFASQGDGMKLSLLETGRIRAVEMSHLKTVIEKLGTADTAKKKPSEKKRLGLADNLGSFIIHQPFHCSSRYVTCFDDVHNRLLSN